MGGSEETRAVSSMFAGSHHQSLHNPDFKTAGRDIFTPTINVNFGSVQGMASPESSHYSRPPPFPVGDKANLNPPLHISEAGGLTRFSQLLSALRRFILQDNAVLEPNEAVIYTIDEGLADPPAFLTTPDVYVLQMLRSGKGLPCWQPRPWKPYASKSGTVPGDVGIFAAESGFKKLFNIWDDDEAVRSTGRRQCGTAYELPERKLVVTESVLLRGEAVAQGTSSQTSWTDDDR